MTDENRKLLTEFLEDDFDYLQKIGMDRDFDKGNDLIALKDKLVENEEWGEFEFYAAYTIWAKDKETSLGFTEWLLNPKRFCQLVADYLEVKP